MVIHTVFGRRERTSNFAVELPRSQKFLLLRHRSARMLTEQSAGP
jgi:hypothetical protein